MKDIKTNITIFNYLINYKTIEITSTSRTYKKTIKQTINGNGYTVKRQLEKDFPELEPLKIENKQAFILVTK